MNFYGVINRLRKKIKCLLFETKWQDIEYFNPHWLLRMEVMSKFIPANCSSLFDLGCGEMSLRRFIPDKISYYPVDYKNRGEGTIICDFNKCEFPTIHADVAFVAGVLEYVSDYQWFIAKIVASSQVSIISYCTLEYFPDYKERKKNTWKNHLKEEQVVKLFKKEGAVLKKKELHFNNTIFVFERI